MNAPPTFSDPRRGLSRVGILVISLLLAIVGIAAVAAILGGGPSDSEGDGGPIVNNDNAIKQKPSTMPASVTTDPLNSTKREEAVADFDPYDKSNLDPSTFELAARVVDPEKKGVSGAVVRIFVASAALTSPALVDAFRSNGLLAYEKTRKTNGDGKFTCKGPFAEGNDYLITVSAKDFAPGLFRWQKIDGGKTTNLGELQLSRGLEIAGKVLDTSGNPLPSARVGFILSPTEASIERFLEQTEPEDYLPSDELGQFRIQHLSEGRYTLIAYAPGFARAASPPILVSKERTTRPVEITLAIGDVLAGTVTNVDGLGIPNAKIKLRLQPREANESMNYEPPSDDSRFFDFPISEVSTADGTFEIHGLLAGANYKLTVSAKEYRSTTVKASSGATDVLVQLKPDFQVRGTVVDQESGQAIAGARVAVFRGKINDLKKGLWSMPVPTGVSDSGGVFVARDDGAAGNATILAWAPGYAPALSPTIQLNEKGDIPETRVELNHGALISGRVSYGAAHEAVAGASLNLYFTGDPTNRSNVSYRTGAFAARTATDSQGNYTFEGLLGGNYVVEARASDLGSGRTDILTIGPVDKRGNTDIDLPAPSAIQGIVGSNQAGVSIRVIANRADGLQFATFVDSDGKFILKNLGAGQYQVRAEKINSYDELFGGGWMRGKAGSLAVNLREGETVDVALEVPDANVGLVVGTINDAGGAGSGYTLVLSSDNLTQAKDQRSPQFSNYKTATADAEGYFEFHGVKEGQYRIYAIPRGRAIVPKNIVASEPVQVFANGTARRDLFGQSGPLSGRVTKQDGTPVAKVKITALVNTTRSPTSALPQGTVFTSNTNKVGGFDFGRLPGGAYDLQIEAPGFIKKTVPAEIYGGSSNPLHVTLDPVPGKNQNNNKPAPKPNPAPTPPPRRRK